MSFAHSALGAVGLVALGSAFIQSVTPEHKFMGVQYVEFSGETVTADRVVYSDTEAGWQVIVKMDGQEEPVCITEANIPNGVGWSVYLKSDPQPQTFTIDEWVGQDGCADRLKSPGSYTAHHSWTPQDGSGTVRHVAKFEVTE